MISTLYRIWHKPWIGWLLRLLFSLLLLTVLLTQVELIEVLRLLGQIPLLLLGLILILFFCVLLIWAWQMSLEAHPLRLPLSLWQILKINLAATFYSLVLPGNMVAGGAASWYKLSRPTGQGIEALALLIHFRLISMLTLVGVGLVCMLFDATLVSSALILIAAVLFGGLVIFSIPLFSPSAVVLLEQWALPRLTWLSLPDWVRDKSRTAWQALTVLSRLDKRLLLLIVFLSLFANILDLILTYLLALAFDINLPIVVIGWMNMLLRILFMIPISLAGLGLREVSLVVMMGSYGFSETQVLSYSLALFSLTAITGLAGGILEGWELFWRRGLEPAVPIETVK